MPRRRETKKPAADSQQLRRLVYLALHDAGTYVDDGAFTDFVRASSQRYAFELRKLFAYGDPSKDDARFMLAALREPGVDPDRAAVLVSECMAVLHMREPYWSHCHAKLVSDSEPRVRILAVRAGAYAHEAAIADESAEVRVAALRYGGWQRHAVLRQALRDADGKVRLFAASYLLTLPEWREECARLSSDPDSSVCAAAREQLAAGINAGRA